MTALEPIDPLPWVRIVHLAASFVVHCDRCKASDNVVGDVVHHAAAKADPAMLKRVHDSHALCPERKP